MSKSDIFEELHTFRTESDVLKALRNIKDALTVFEDYFEGKILSDYVEDHRNDIDGLFGDRGIEEFPTYPASDEVYFNDLVLCCISEYDLSGKTEEAKMDMVKGLQESLSDFRDGKKKRNARAIRKHLSEITESVFLLKKRNIKDFLPTDIIDNPVVPGSSEDFVDIAYIR